MAASSLTTLCVQYVLSFPRDRTSVCSRRRGRRRRGPTSTSGPSTWRVARRSWSASSTRLDSSKVHVATVSLLWCCLSSGLWARTYVWYLQTRLAARTRRYRRPCRRRASRASHGAASPPRLPTPWRQNPSRPSPSPPSTTGSWSGSRRSCFRPTPDRTSPTTGCRGPSILGKRWVWCQYVGLKPVGHVFFKLGGGK